MWGAGASGPTGTWGQGEGPRTALPAPRQANVRTSVASLCCLLSNRSRLSTGCAEVCCPFIPSCICIISALRFAAVGCIDCDSHPPDSLRLFIKICEIKMRKYSESGHLVALQKCRQTVFEESVANQETAEQRAHGGQDTSQTA